LASRWWVRIAATPQPRNLFPASTPALRAAVWLGVVVLVGLGLRGHSLATRSLWFDEAFSWRLTEFPLAEMVQRVAKDNNPPLYFLLLKIWAAVFGVSEWALRGLSVLLGGATIVGIYLFTWEAFRQPDEAAEQAARRRRLALFAAAAVAFSVFQIRWAWEVRTYTLGTALAAFASWALFRALRVPPSALRPWLLFGLLDLLFAYSHYYALFTIAAQAIFLAGLLLLEARGSPRAIFRDRRLWHALLAGYVVAIGWLPWLPAFSAQWDQVQAAFWSRPVRVRDVVEACGRMLWAPENGRIDPLEGQAAAGVFVVILLAVLWRGRAGAWYVFLAAVIPLAICVLLSRSGTHVFSCRYLLFAHLFLLTAFGVVVGRISFPLGRGLLATYILAACVGIYWDFWRTLDVAHKPGARAAAAYIDSQRRPGEPVVVSSPLFFLPLLYHTADRRDWYVFAAERGLIHYEGAAAVRSEEIVNAPLTLSLSPSRGRGWGEGVPARRVWVVNMDRGGWGHRAVPMPTGWTMRSEQRFPEVYDVQGEVVVVEYEIVPGSQDGQRELSER
jgi:hypothetical protein